MNNNFANNLRKIRKEHNLSQEQLAEELGVSRQAISKWESGAAYPEMDKIIALCDKFEINIDDLLYRDVKEIKGEQESKTKLNQAVDDFFKFITDSVTLFSHLSGKDKFKLLFEQLVLLTLLLALSAIGLTLVNGFFRSLLHLLPARFYSYIYSVTASIVVIFFAISILILMAHIFKTRYLNYFHFVDKKSEPTVNVETETESAPSFVQSSQQPNLIIRDPKDSNDHFIKGLSKITMLIIKFFALCFVMVFGIMLIGSLFLFILSFLLHKTGLFFVGLLSGTLSMSFMSLILTIIFINFILNRKNDKKRMIISFLTSLIVFGASCGLIFMGSLNFNVVKPNTMAYTTNSIELKMTDDLYFHSNVPISYVESDQQTIKVEYKIHKYCELRMGNLYKNGLFLNSYCANPLQIMREAISELNENKVINNFNGELGEVKIYTSKENIEKLQKNEENRYTSATMQQLEEYQDKISQLEQDYATSMDKISEYESRLSEIPHLQSEIQAYEKQIEELNKQLENAHQPQ